MMTDKDILERAKNADYETCLCRDDAIEMLDSLRKELIEEIERLQYAVEAMQETANKDKVSHREQVESLTSELSQRSKELEEVRGAKGTICLDPIKHAELQKELEAVKRERDEAFKMQEKLEGDLDDRDSDFRKLEAKNRELNLRIASLSSKSFEQEKTIGKLHSELEKTESSEDLVSCSRCGAAGFIDCGDGEDEICPDCGGKGAIDRGEIERLKSEIKELKAKVEEQRKWKCNVCGMVGDMEEAPNIERPKNWKD